MSADQNGQRLKQKFGVPFAHRHNSKVDAFGVHCNCAPIVPITVPRALHMGIYHIQEVQMPLQPGKNWRRAISLERVQQKCIWSTAPWLRSFREVSNRINWSISADPLPSLGLGGVAPGITAGVRFWPARTSLPHSSFPRCLVMCL